MAFLLKNQLLAKCRLKALQPRPQQLGGGIALTGGAFEPFSSTVDRLGKGNIYPVYKAIFRTSG